MRQIQKGLRVDLRQRALKHWSKSGHRPGQLLVLWLMLLFSALILSPRLSAQEAVLEMKTTVDVRKDGNLEVLQRIRIRAERNLFKNGLSLDMPLSLESPNGGRAQPDITGLQVTMDNGDETFTAEKFGRVLQLRTGGKRDLKPGEYVFDVRYLARRQLLFRNGEDELVFHVVPYEWDVPVQDASIEISLPDDRSSSRVFAASGDEDARAGSVLVRRDNSRVRVQASRPLPPNHGMKVAVSFASGSVARPSQTEKVIILFRQYEHLLAPLTGLAGLFSLGIAAKWFGRWHRGKVTLQPPVGYSPGTVQFYEDGTATFRGVVLTILGLAAKGYLTIEESDQGEFMLQRTWRDNDLGLSKVDRAVTIAFYQNRPTRFLVNSHHAPELRAARRAMGEAAAMEFEAAHIRKHPLLMGLVLLLPMIASIAMILMSPAANWVLMFPLLTLAGIALLYISAMPSNPPWQIGLENRSFSDLLATWATTRKGQIGLALMTLGTLVTAAKAGPVEALFALLLGAVAAWIYHGSKRPEGLGAKLRARFEQLKSLLAEPAGESDTVQLPASTYETMLPYAAAWDVHPDWAERYRRINNSTGVANARPRWLTTPRAIHDPREVATLLVEGLTQAVERAGDPGKR
jgi:hypothetical protein